VALICLYSMSAPGTASQSWKLPWHVVTDCAHVHIRTVQKFAHTYYTKAFTRSIGEERNRINKAHATNQRIDSIRRVREIYIFT
jgi:hypothetical protein